MAQEPAWGSDALGFVGLSRGLEEGYLRLIAHQVNEPEPPLLCHCLHRGLWALRDSGFRIVRGSPAGETDAVTRPQGKQSLDADMTTQKPGVLGQAVQLGTRGRG